MLYIVILTVCTISFFVGIFYARSSNKIDYTRDVSRWSDHKWTHGPRPSETVQIKNGFAPQGKDLN